MSVTFAQRGRSPLTPTQIQNMLNENSQLLQTIQEYQNKGKANECYQYQEIVHRNLVYLATVADANQNINALLPPPRGVLIPPVQHNVNNANAPPTQGPVPPMNEMATPQAPPPNNFSPMNNVHRGQPQPIINPQKLEDIFGDKWNVVPECLSTSASTILLRPTQHRLSESENEENTSTPSHNELFWETQEDRHLPKKRLRISPNMNIIKEINKELSEFREEIREHHRGKTKLQQEMIEIWKNEGKEAADMRKNYIKLQEEKIELQKRRLQIKLEKLKIKKAKLGIMENDASDQ